MIQITKLDNGFEYIHIENKTASAKIALQGAHIFSYKTDAENLYLSSKATFEKEKAIRGGIPICWPVFGKPSYSELNQHGFARNRMFELIDSKDEIDISIVTLKLTDTKHQFFDYECKLTITFFIGKDLTIELTTKNLDNKSFKITQALHTYFLISDISKISIVGLENNYYFDQLDARDKIQTNSITIDSEVDRIYTNINKTITIKDNTKKIDITNTNSKSCIVWNPWIKKSKYISDMDNEDYKKFVCIESANALNDFIVLESGDTHTLKTKITF